MEAVKEPDLVSGIMAFEDGTISTKGAIELFARLVKTGLAWTLQGFYGRTAEALINGGYISESGEILRYPDDG